MTTTRTSKATIAGILSIVAGGSGLIGSCVLAGLGLIGGGILRAIPEDLPRGISFVPIVLFLPLAAMLFVFASLSIAGGIAALRGGPFGLAVAGAAAALFTFLPLGIAALVFIVLAESEIGSKAPSPAPPTPQ